MKLPTFLIIGVNKGGTTALYKYLNQHPDVFMSPVKEPMFFCFEGKISPYDKSTMMTTRTGIPRTLEEYSALFSSSGNETQLGEASTAYFHNSHVARRIREVIPDCKLILVLRNPVERAFSNYRMYVKRGLEKRYFRTAVEDELFNFGNLGKLPQGQRYLSLSLYGDHLESYLKHFERDQIAVFCYETEWRSKPSQTIRKIFRLLDIDQGFEPDMSTPYNISDAQDALIATLANDSDFRSAYESADAKDKIRLAQAIPPQLDGPLRQRMEDFFQKDVERTESLIDRKFNWL